MKKIEIWTFKMCPFCVKAKRLFTKLDIPFTEHVVPNGSPKLGELEKVTGCDTLPQIFVDGEFIGDCSKLYDIYRAGDLMEMIGR